MEENPIPVNSCFILHWRIMFQLRRGVAVLTPEIFRPLYLALVRPILKYDQQASSPYLRRDIVLMERIQRLATRMVKCMIELPYEDRLCRLDIFSLERRGLRGYFTLAYIILHGRLDLSQADFLEAPAERNFQVAPPQFSLTTEESSLLCETFRLVE